MSGSARTEFSGGGKKKGRLSITSPKYTANPLAKCGMVLELEAVDNRWTRPAERKAKVTAVSAVNGSAVGSIKVGTLVFNRDPATGKLVSTKRRPPRRSATTGPATSAVRCWTAPASPSPWAWA